MSRSALILLDHIKCMLNFLKLLFGCGSQFRCHALGQHAIRMMFHRKFTVFLLDLFLVIAPFGAEHGIVFVNVVGDADEAALDLLVVIFQTENSRSI